MQLGVVVLFLGQGAAFANEASQALVKALENIKIYQASFSQQIKDANGELVSSAKGEMTVSRPNKFHWQGVSPDPILVVGDGNTLWSYDKELAQVTKQPLQAALTASPARLLAGSLTYIEKDFNIKQMDKKQCNAASDTCFQLEPLQKDSPFKEAYIGFSKGKIIVVRMTDALGQNIYTDFTNVKVNHKINNQIFVFVPPKGVDVIQAGN